MACSALVTTPHRACNISHFWVTLGLLCSWWVFSWITYKHGMHAWRRRAKKRVTLILSCTPVPQGDMRWGNLSCPRVTVGNLWETLFLAASPLCGNLRVVPYMGTTCVTFPGSSPPLSLTNVLGRFQLTPG